MRPLILVLCAAVLFSRATPASGQDAMIPARAEEAPRRISGTVSQVGFAFSFIVVICEEGYLTFHVTDETAIIRDRRKASLDEIDPEDAVTVQYRVDEEGRRIALSIRDSTSKRSY